MARKSLIAGNWKMNKTAREAAELASALKARVDEMNAVDVLVCPPYTSLATVAGVLAGTPIAVGAQNVHWAENGAFTGEVSAAMLKEVPVRYAIIGHSERRQYFAETDATVNKRVKAALAAGLEPVMCVGETLEQRQAGQTEAVVKTQLEGGLEGLNAAQMATVTIAYEPVWAIGTGETATPEQAQQVHAFLRSLLRAKFANLADTIRILYGGSMKPENARELIAQSDIDGGLIGGASLKVQDFLGIIKNAG